ncbi:MAG: Ig-like domain-containing protein, partial [Acidobacteriota bacterium]
MIASLFTRRTAWLLPTARVLLITIFTLSLFSFDAPRQTTRGAAQNVSPLVAVSAASFQSNRAVAPNSIVAAFTSGILPQGTFMVATDAIPGTPGVDLPTLLGNFSVEIHGRSAGIFALVNTPGFDQLNILVPADLEPGKGPIVVKNGAGQIVAAGEIEVGTVTPAVFTANSSGSGVPAALIYRYRNGAFLGVENVFQYNAQSGSFIPRPIDLGPPEDELFLILFLTGIRKVASANATRVLIGGEELIPLFVGEQGSFVGLDQVNLKLSRTLRGRLTLAFTAIGFGTSNLCEIEIAPPSNSPPSVNALSNPESLAGEMVEISGTGFSSDSEVIISDVNKKLYNAKIVEAHPTSLRVLVPYGAGTGNLVVRNSRGEASYPFKMRTSLSGIVQVAQKQPDGTSLRVGAPQVTIRLVGFNLPPIQTSSDGSFLMPDVPPTSPLSSGLVFEVDGTSNPVLGLAKEKRRIRVVTANRDNPFPEYIELKSESNQSVPTIAGAMPEGQFAVPAQATPNESEVVGQTGQVVFEPNGSAVQFPDGGPPVTSLKVTVLDTGRTPSDLPYGQYSSTIVQLSPFGARIQPGGRLTFPNTDSLPANKTVTLYRFDQTPNSNTIGQFVTAGTATVTADGQKIQTASTAVIESTYYFVSDSYPTTTIYGRVVEENDAPARGALVQVSGQSIFSLTDDNGTFFLINVPVVGTLPLAVEVSFLRPDGTVDRAQRTALLPGAGGLTYVSPPIKLPGQGLTKAPLIVAPKNLSIEAGKTSDFSFLAYARVVGLTLQPITVTGAQFASVLSLGNDRYTLRLAPGAGATGNYTLVLGANDSQNQTSTSSIDLEVKAGAGNAPVATGQSVLTNEDTPVNIALAGIGGTIFRIVNQPLRGRLEGTAPNVVYRPDQDFNGSDTFSFAVGNGTVESAPAVVSIAVQPVPDQPQLEVGNAFSTNIGQKLAFVITGRDGDAQTLILNSTGLPAGATIKQTTATSWLFEWTPTAAQIGSYTLNLTLLDNGFPVQSATGSVAITVDAKWARSPGIDGGLIQCFLVNGSTIFAGTDFGGVFRSTDNGASWAPSGLASTDVISLLNTGGAILAGTGVGVYRSTDNGASWTEVSNGLPKLASGEYRPVLSLAVSGNSFFAGTTAGVYRSTDSAASWAIASTGLPNKLVDDQVLVNV